MVGYLSVKISSFYEKQYFLSYVLNNTRNTRESATALLVFLTTGRSGHTFIVF